MPPAGLHRQVVFGGLRLSLYDPVKHYYQGALGEGLGTKVLSALTTGALAITVARPTELVKASTRGESNGCNCSRTGPVAYGGSNVEAQVGLSQLPETGQRLQGADT